MDEIEWRSSLIKMINESGTSTLPSGTLEQPSRHADVALLTVDILRSVSEELGCSSDS